MRKSSQNDILGGTISSKNILDHFSELTDPREGNKRHKLMDIITILKPEARFIGEVVRRHWG